jgi:hypothetical protein
MQKVVGSNPISRLESPARMGRHSKTGGVASAGRPVWGRRPRSTRGVCLAPRRAEPRRPGSCRRASGCGGRRPFGVGLAKRRQCEAAHHALVSSVGDALAAPRAALGVLIDGELSASEESHLASIRLGRRGSRCRSPCGRSMHKTPHLDGSLQPSPTHVRSSARASAASDAGRGGACLGEAAVGGWRR